MKKIVLIALPALALIASCSKTEVTPAQSDPQQIAFTPLNGKLSTRAMIDGTAYATSDPSFGSFAYYLASGDWNSAANAKNASLYVPTSEVKYSATATTWTTDTPYYWPKSGKVTFFAYSPYNYQETAGGAIAVTKGADNDGLVIYNYDVDAHQLTDLMVADITKSKDKTANETNGGYKGVPIVFQHKLSQIVGINLETVKTENNALVEHDYANKHDGTTGKEYAAGDVVFKLKNVSINMLNTKGHFSYSNTYDTPVSSWSAQSAPKGAYVWYNYVSDNSDAPEQFSGNTKFELTYNNKHTANANAYLLVLPQPLVEGTTTTTTTTSGDVTTRNLDKPYLHLEYQVLTYTDANNYATENVTEDVDLYIIHGGTAGSATTGIEIAQNKKITYDIKINLENRQIYWAPSVVDWEAQKSFTYTIE